MAAVYNIATPPQLYAAFLDDHGLTEDDVDILNLRLVGPEEIRALLRFDYTPAWSGVAIPYPDSDFVAVRRLGVVAPGRAKYLTPAGYGPGPLFLPPAMGIDWDDVRADPRRGVVVTEGQLKSYIGCRLGVPVVGLGGVTMGHALFDDTWEWRGRTAFICFDHDPRLKDGTPVPAGAYKPEVEAALGRLATGLMAQGAEVKLLSVGLAAVAAGLSPEKKWGLDDFVLAVGDVGRAQDLLLATMADPPHENTELAAMLEHCVMVTGTNRTHVYDLRVGSQKAMADFRDAWGHLAVSQQAGGKIKSVPLPEIWYRHPMRLTCSGYVMDPTREHGVIEQGEGPAVINVWRPFPRFGQEDAAVREGFDRYVRGLMGDEVVEFAGREMPTWQWVGLWVGHMLVHPEERTSQAVIVASEVGGIGKSLFGEIVGCLVGREHAGEVPGSVLFKNFNADMRGKVWAFTNELNIKFLVSEDELNDLITQEDIRIEPKGRDVERYPNLLRRYFTTNRSSPARVGRRQRRFFVVEPPLTQDAADGGWSAWVNSVVASWKRRPDALAAVRAWFLDLWASTGAAEWWSPTARVPLTEASEEMAEAGMTATQRVVEDLLEWAEGEFDGVVVLQSSTAKRFAKIRGDLGSRIRARGGRTGNAYCMEEPKKPMRHQRALKERVLYWVADLRRRLDVTPSERRVWFSGLEADWAAHAAAEAQLKILALCEDYGIRRE